MWGSALPARTGGPTVVNAYILIQTEVGKAASVASEVRSIAGVAEAEDVTGPYDVIVRAEAKTVDELGKLVVARIQSVEGITRTLTCPVVHL
jgi:DNA-binding Lrp family transcriptional regulator